MSAKQTMSEGFALSELAGEVVAGELDWWLDRFFAIGEAEQPEPPASMLADEYRLVLGSRSDGFTGITADVLGVVNEDFALRKAREAHEQWGSGVVVERRKVLRGGWVRTSVIGARHTTGDEKAT